MFTPLSDVYKKFSLGEFIIVFDEHREVEGDFFVLAENITAEKINFLLTNAKGMICIACDEKILKNLNIPLLVEKNENPHGTNFCVPVDAKSGITTGVSANDRAKTIQILANQKSSFDDLVRPGHTMPLLAKNPKIRFGHTESATEMAKKCGKIPVVVICEILNKSGEKATKTELLELSKTFNCAITSLEILKKDLL